MAKKKNDVQIILVPFTLSDARQLASDLMNNDNDLLFDKDNEIDETIFNERYFCWWPSFRNLLQIAKAFIIKPVSFNQANILIEYMDKLTPVPDPE